LHSISPWLSTLALVFAVILCLAVAIGIVYAVLVVCTCPWKVLIHAADSGAPRITAAGTMPCLSGLPRAAVQQ
jgi:hypothetical protein